MLGKFFDFDVSMKLRRSEWEKKKKESKLKYSVPNNLNVEKDSEFSLRNILNSTSGNKTDFMYSVILNGFVEKMEPNYIREGLKWLME